MLKLEQSKQKITYSWVFTKMCKLGIGKHGTERLDDVFALLWCLFYFAGKE